jgi:transcriptional regulator with XRE-family HTH domain
VNPDPEVTIGERVRFYRDAQHKTQSVVAGLAGITVDYLSQIERGTRTPTIATLHRLAAILRVRTSALLGEPASDQEEPGYPSVRSICRAFMATDILTSSDAPVDLAHLRDRVQLAWKTWQTSPTRYSDTVPLVPDLLADCERATRSFQAAGEDDQRRDAFRLLADLYSLLRTVTKRVGRLDLSLLAADRAYRAAEQADDPLRIAATRWNIGHVLLADNQADAAEEITLKTAESLEPRLPDLPADFTAVFGALHLVAAVAAARNGDAWAGRDRLRDHAAPAAAAVGEGNVQWTVFGPTNVGLHAVSIEMEAGEAAEALRIADAVAAARSPSVERRATYFLELARCYDQQREDAAVLLHLLRVEREAPEDMKFNTLARDLVRGVVRRARPSYADDARGLAKRIGLLSN